MEPDVPFLGHESFDEYSTLLFRSVVTGAGLSNDLPHEDHSFLSSAHPAYRQAMAKMAKRLLHLQQKIILQRNPDGSADLIDLDPTVDDLDQRFKNDVQEEIDSLFESVDSFLDETKAQDEKTTFTINSLQFRDRPTKPGGFTRNKTKEIPKPQEKWVDAVDNTYTVFYPKIYNKDNATLPLDASFLAPPPARPLDKIPSEYGPYTSYPHPYRHELMFLQYPADQMQKKPEILYPPLKLEACTWVDTPGALEELIRVLSSEREIAIDLEHHSWRTYQGITCLMQISTRRQDWIVDTLALFQQLYTLNVVFSNPKILKVFHGANWDVQWLQRDFGIYIVNMFDTGQACRVLGLPSFALKYLLHEYCSVTANKELATSDWRVRPLSEELKKYACEDTHYLLYIYDRLRNETLSRTNGYTLLQTIYNNSRGVCLLSYEKDLFNEKSHYRLLLKFNERLDEYQYPIFVSLVAWRDYVARLKDESPQFVLNDRSLFLIAKRMPLDSSSLLSCVTPAPPLLRFYANVVVELIQKGIENPQHQPAELFTADLSNTNTLANQEPHPMQLEADSFPQRKLTSSYGKDTNKIVWNDQVLSRAISQFTVLLADINQGFSSDTPLVKSLFSDKQAFLNTPGIQLALKIEKEVHENFLTTLLGTSGFEVPAAPNPSVVKAEPEPEASPMQIDEERPVEVPKKTKKKKTDEPEVPTKSLREQYAKPVRGPKRAANEALPQEGTKKRKVGGK